MFVRAKKERNGKVNHWLVVNCRVNGKVKQKAVVYLGPVKTLSEAIAYWTAELEYQRQSAALAHKAIEAIEVRYPNLKLIPKPPFPRHAYPRQDCVAFDWHWRYVGWVRAERKRADETEKRLAKLHQLYTEANREPPPPSWIGMALNKANAIEVKRRATKSESRIWVKIASEFAPPLRAL